MQARRQEGQPLSEGKQLAKFVNEAIRGATRSGSIYDFSPGSPNHTARLPGAPLPDMRPQGMEPNMPFNPGVHIENFTDMLDLHKIKAIDRREATGAVREFFKKWKAIYAGRLVSLGTNRETVHRVLGLTLQDTADYAAEQFNKYTKEAMQAVPGSKEFEDARIKSDYWSMLDELLGPAADPDY